MTVGLDAAEGPTSAAPSRRHWHCEVCAGWVLPRKPHWGWRVAEVSVWLLIPAVITVGAKGPGLVLLPIVFVMGAGLFGPLREQSAAEARCPDCNRYVYPPSGGQ